MDTELEYGDIVQVTAGKYAGQVGVFDDHDENGRLVIVLGPIGVSPYIVVSRNRVGRATDEQAKKLLDALMNEKWTRKTLH